MSQLKKQLAEVNGLFACAVELLADASRKHKAIKQQIAECQAREKLLREHLQYWSQGCHDKRLDTNPDSAALDTLLKQAKREALLEAATEFEECNPTAEIARCSVGDELRRMAHELQS